MLESIIFIILLTFIIILPGNVLVPLYCTFSADYNQLEGQVVAKSNVNKAQEDLAKARKLIEAMRSLEKGASKPTQLLTKDNSQRLHEVASSKPKKGKDHVKRYYTFSNSVQFTFSFSLDFLV